MAHPFKHAESSAKKFGGKAEDYLVDNWLALIWTVEPHTMERIVSIRP
jgi:hypothetical protein